MKRSDTTTITVPSGIDHGDARRVCEGVLGQIAAWSDKGELVTVVMPVRTVEHTFRALAATGAHAGALGPDVRDATMMLGAASAGRSAASAGDVEAIAWSVYLALNVAGLVAGGIGEAPEVRQDADAFVFSHPKDPTRCFRCDFAEVQRQRAAGTSWRQIVVDVAEAVLDSFKPRVVTAH